MHLVLIETAGNQGFIFATNKLRENLGASELVWRVGTKWTLEAVRELGGPEISCESPAAIRRDLLDPEVNRPLSDEAGVEVMVATSGKSLLLVGDPAVGRRIVRAVTLRALAEAPGLAVRGAVVEVGSSRGDLHRAVMDAHEVVRRLRTALPAGEARFLRLPVVAECSTSGLPAALLDSGAPGDVPVLRSAVARAKHAVVKEAMERLGQVAPGLRLCATLKQLEERRLEEEAAAEDRPRAAEDVGAEAAEKEEAALKRLSWLGVVHADGNGVGSLFAGFDQYVEPEKKESELRAYVDRQRRFSLALDMATEESFKSALQTLLDRGGGARPEGDGRGRTEEDEEGLPAPVVPIVLGGDDLTVLVPGDMAVRFTRDFLVAFEERSGCEELADRLGGVLPQVARKASGHGRLGACAGVAIVKPHYPFHAAYGMAEELLRSAKTVKKRARSEERTFPASALDYHVHYASVPDLPALRGGWEVGDSRLWARPYVVTPAGNLAAGLAELDEEAVAWFRQHDWSRLEKRVEGLTGKVGDDTEDGDERRLPRTMLHGLREALVRKGKHADADLLQILHRYPDLRKWLEDNGQDGAPTLFWSEADPCGKTVFRTAFLDALDLGELWK